MTEGAPYLVVAGVRTEQTMRVQADECVDRVYECRGRIGRGEDHVVNDEARVCVCVCVCV